MRRSFQRTGGNRYHGGGADSYPDTPPPKTPAISLTNVSWLLNTRTDAMKSVSILTFFFLFYTRMTIDRDDAGV